MAVLLLLCAALPQAGAQERTPPSWSVTLENDKWGDGADRHYTHGTRVTRRATQVPQWLRRVAAPLGCMACTAPRAFELRFGQEIYTPEDTWSTGLVADDRPYAGWAYGELAVQGERAIAGARGIGFNELALEVGVVGPAALADRTQELLHRETAVQMPRGWDNQLRNELGAAINYTRGVRFPFGRGGASVGHDIAPYFSGVLGTMRTEVGGGLRMRSGRNLAAVGERQSSGWHVFVDLSAVYVAHNLLLDGNSSGESHSVAREPVVTRVAAGLEYRGPRFQVTLGRERRSREFVGQRETNEYGVLGFSVGR